MLYLKNYCKAILGNVSGGFTTLLAGLVFFVTVLVLGTGHGAVGPYGIVNGTITGADTGMPIEGALIVVNDQKFATSQKDGRYHCWNYTWENEITVYASGYEELKTSIDVVEDEENTVNFNLIPGAAASVPPDTGTWTGIIKDGNTGNPIFDAIVRVGDSTYNFYGISAKDGSFILKSRNGYFAFSVTAEGYKPLYEPYSIGNNETISVNISLAPDDEGETGSTATTSPATTTSTQPYEVSTTTTVAIATTTTVSYDTTTTVSENDTTTTTTADNDNTGELGGPCDDNGTCNAGLECINDVCLGITDNCSATYVLGEHNPQLEVVRRFRDEVLSGSSFGKIIIELYERNSHKMTVAMQRHPALRTMGAIILKSLIPAIELFLK